MKKKTSLYITGALILILLLLTVAIVLLRTFLYSGHSDRRNVMNAAPEIVSDTDEARGALFRLAGALRFATVNAADYNQTDFAPFEAFARYLEDTFPQVHATMPKSVINGHGLVYHWRGADPAAKPLLFLSHYDVVPAGGEDYAPASAPGATAPPGAQIQPVTVFRPDDPALPPIDSYQTGWDFPPFSGAVANGRVYGRGALDMKAMLLALMETAEKLIAAGFTPPQDIWFAFGNDEETSGQNGALRIAEHFRQQGITFDAVFDEGGIIDATGVGMIDRPVALVGIAEKGFLTVRIRVTGMGGHSSMPPPRSSLVAAAEIIGKLNDHQMPQRLIPPIRSFLDHLGPETGFGTRLALANPWLFKPLLLRQLGKKPSSNALTRTTTAITMARGSDATNVLSTYADVTVNFRLLQGDSVADVLRHVEEVCRGYEVEITTLNAREPSAISSTDTAAFRLMEEAVHRSYPEAIVTPYLTVGGTDGYKYEIVSDRVYRFMPLFLNEYELQLIHNDNEHIKITDYLKMLDYFRYLISRYGSDDAPEI